MHRFIHYLYYLLIQKQKFMKKSLLLLSLITTIGVQAQNFWTEVSPFPSNSNLIARQISIVDNNVVWVNGYNYGDIFDTTSKWSHSSDSGLTWTSGIIDLENSNLGVSSIFAISASTAYASVYSKILTDFGGVWKTQDGGITWVNQPTATFNTASFANFIHFFDANNGIVVGDPESGYFEIYTTTDAGENWVRVPQINLPLIIHGEYGYTLNFETKGSTIWFGTSQGRIFKSNNNGLNWTVSQTPVADIQTAKYAFKNVNEGILITDEWQSWRTIDGGTTWNSSLLTGTYRNSYLCFVPETLNTYFSIGNDYNLDTRGTSYSTDGGNYWIDLNNVDTDPVIPNSVEFKNGTIGFCIGYYQSEIPMLSNQKVFKLTDPLNLFLKTDTFSLKNKVIVSPNPTSGLVKISGNSIREITIVDVLGKTILNEKYNLLNEVSLDIASFENGIYVAKINSDGGISSTIKIMKN